MLSFKGAISELNNAEERVRPWWTFSTRLLSAIEGAVVEVSSERDAPLREIFVSIRENLGVGSPAATLAQQGTAAEQAVQTLARELTEARSQREKEFKKIVWITAEAGAAMIRSGNTHAEEITNFAARVQATSCLDSVVQIRCQMADRVAELNGMALRIQQESQQTATVLQREIQKVQERLKAAESLAETDALTKLGNRRLLERTVAAAIDAQQHFCVAVLDLNGFKDVNDQFGHTQGDRLLQAVATDLKAAVRDTDEVGRWGGDEFVLVLREIDQQGAEARIEQIGKRVFGDFLIEGEGKTIRITMSGCFGIAEYRPGETYEQLFERADHQLNDLKQNRRMAARPKSKNVIPIATEQKLKVS
jgi:diguanylate cyclase